MWDLIVLIPDHCLSIYLLESHLWYSEDLPRFWDKFDIELINGRHI